MALDRAGITTAFADMLKADTGTLYGVGKLLSIIEDKMVEFSKAKVSNLKPYGLYLWTSSEGTRSVRSQNEDTDYNINMRFEAVATKIETAKDRLDDAYERVKYLTNDQMWTGLNLTQYYTDSNRRIDNIEPIISEMPEPDEIEGQHLIVEIEGAILVTINRWK